MERHEKEEQEQGAGYERPQVIRVSLRAEEAVLGHCKVTASAGPVGGGCTTGAMIRCNSFGS